jgi:hypothetical protein
MSGTYDLIYCENRDEYQDYQRRLLEAFPDCTFKDASDFVHADRFVIQRDIPVDDGYYEALIRQGITSSLSLQFALLEGNGLIGRILDKLEKE